MRDKYYERPPPAVWSSCSFWVHSKDHENERKGVKEREGLIKEAQDIQSTPCRRYSFHWVHMTMGTASPSETTPGGWEGVLLSSSQVLLDVEAWRRWRGVRTQRETKQCYGWNKIAAEKGATEEKKDRVKEKLGTPGVERLHINRIQNGTTFSDWWHMGGWGGKCHSPYRLELCVRCHIAQTQVTTYTYKTGMECFCLFVSCFVFFLYYEIKKTGLYQFAIKK